MRCRPAVEALTYTADAEGRRSARTSKEVYPHVSSREAAFGSRLAACPVKSDYHARKTNAASSTREYCVSPVLAHRA
eukprot:7020100-Prymnesium_polylepis.1